MFVGGIVVVRQLRLRQRCVPLHVGALLPNEKRLLHVGQQLRRVPDLFQQQMRCRVVRNMSAMQQQPRLFGQIGMLHLQLRLYQFAEVLQQQLRCRVVRNM